MTVAHACNDFAPDSLGDSPPVCTGCLWHVAYHNTPFSLGYADGWDGLATGLTFDDDPESPRSIAYDNGRTQGEIDAARIEEALQP
jgi:hypothetical protein